MHNLVVYLRERFPLGLTSLHALATAALVVGISAGTASFGDTAKSALLIGGSFFFFMFRMRVTDEFKDRRHDDKNYPNRPVQRGLVSTHDLLSLGMLALTIELVCAWYAGALTGNYWAIGWHLGILVYSVLTHFEFFNRAFLDRHFNFTFAIHQVIFVLYPAWGFAIWGTQITIRSLLGAAAFVAFMAAMEVVRKYEVRLDPQGQPVQDTYLTVWKTGAFWLMFAVVTVAGSTLATVAGNVWHIAIAATFGLPLWLRRADAKSVRGLVAIAFIVQSVVTLVWR